MEQAIFFKKKAAPLCRGLIYQTQKFIWMIRNVGLMNQAPTEYEQTVKGLNYEVHFERL